MKTILILFSIVMLTPILAYGQAKPCYTNLTFKEFRTQHTPPDLAYLKSIYRSVKYPPVSRENQEEDVIRVQIINHSRDSTEVIVSGSTKLQLLEETSKKIAQVNAEYLKKTNIPYFTEYFVEYDLEPFDSINTCNFEEEDCNTIIIMAYRVPVIKE